MLIYLAAYSCRVTQNKCVKQDRRQALNILYFLFSFQVSKYRYTLKSPFTNVLNKWQCKRNLNVTFHYHKNETGSLYQFKETIWLNNLLHLYQSVSFLIRNHIFPINKRQHRNIKLCQTFEKFK